MDTPEARRQETKDQDEINLVARAWKVALVGIKKGYSNRGEFEEDNLTDTQAMTVSIMAAAVLPRLGNRHDR